MRTVTLTNDPVRLSFVRALLHDAGIQSWVLDEYTSSIEGSISAIPRRIVVADDDAVHARQVLDEAGAA